MNREDQFDRYDPIDQKCLALLAALTHSLSPTAARMALMDWVNHLLVAPGKRASLLELAAQQMAQFLSYNQQAIAHAWQPSLTGSKAAPLAAAPAPIIHDRRFAAPEWQQWPFNVTHQAHLLAQQWWDNAARGVHGVAAHHEDLMAFAFKQIFEAYSPHNFLATNPLLQQQSLAEKGENLRRGMRNFQEDWARQMAGHMPVGSDQFIPGKTVAITPGKVVLKNNLVELIQYQATTQKVHPEPVLLVPAWIMKYYILDLSAHNSLVRYLVDQGHTVFCISWKNPESEDAELGMDDYLQDGFWAALAAINAIVPNAKIHAAGYCLGGTLLTLAAAAMAREQDARLASITLLAAQTDFSEPGELALFIDENQVSMLEAQMASKGYLEGSQMAAAFQMLRSFDLHWSSMVRGYGMGERTPMVDLMAWNADSTRMPARMHSQYLRRLFLNNDLSQGRYPVQDKTVALCDLEAPIFCVGTATDHVAPWRSVYKLHLFTAAPITFVLTSGGHNAGIVNEPGRAGRYFQLLTRDKGARYMAQDDWLVAAPRYEGSWWPAWSNWLKERSREVGRCPQIGALAQGYGAVGDAPGVYVLAK